MRNLTFILLATAATALTMTGASCKKSSSSGGSGSQGSGLVRIQQGVDPDITNDSVYLLKYDSQKRLITVIDSLNQDTLSATYNGAGQLSQIAESSAYSNDQLAATYNANGQLTEIDYTLFGESDQYVFTYNGQSPSQCVWSTNAGSGSLFLWRTYGYTTTGGNITDIKEYDKTNTFIGERKLTYGAQANTFKALSLFDWGGRLGTDDFTFLETFFNANMPAATAWYGASSNLFYTTNQTVTMTGANPVKLVAVDQYPDGSTDNLFTWSFTYK